MENEILHQILAEVKDIRESQAVLENEMLELKSTQNRTNHNVEKLSRELAVIQSDIKTIKKDVKFVKDEIKCLWDEDAAGRKRMKAHEETMHKFAL